MMCTAICPFSLLHPVYKQVQASKNYFFQFTSYSAPTELNLRSSALQQFVKLPAEDLNKSWFWSRNQKQIIDILYDSNEPQGLTPHMLKTLFSKLSDENLKSFLSEILHDSRPFPLEILVKTLNRNSLERVVNGIGRNILTPPNYCKGEKRHFVLDYLQEILDIYLKALGVLGRSRPPSSDWDKFYRFFTQCSALSFPIYILQHVMHFVATPLYAYAIATALSGLLTISIAVYVKYLRPIPTNIAYCQRVKEITTRFFADRQEILKYLNNQIEEHHKNVLIHGESGAGKSMLARELGKRFTTKVMYQVDSEACEKDMQTPVAKLRDIFEEARRYPKQIVLYIDQIDKLAKDENFIAMLEDELENDYISIVATCTNDRLKALFENNNLTTRFLKYHLETPNADDLITILEEYFHHIGKGIYCHDLRGVLKQLIEQVSRVQKELGLGSMLKATTKILLEVINKINPKEPDNEDERIKLSLLLSFSQDKDHGGPHLTNEAVLKVIELTLKEIGLERG